MQQHLRLMLAATGLALVPSLQEPESAAPRAQLATTAADYFEAYAKWDLDALQRFHSEQSTWYDPTSAEIGPAAGPFQGAAAIRAGLELSTRGIQDLHFVFDEHFVSADRAVAIGRLLYTLPGEQIGPGGKDVKFDLRVVTAVRIVDGVVIEHVDYSDFSDWLATARKAQSG